MEEFITNLFIAITSIWTERDHKSALLYQKVKLYPFSDSSPEAKYSVFLTSNAFESVLKQLQLTEKVTFTNPSDDTKVLVETSHGLKAVATTSCECIFNTAICLYHVVIFLHLESYEMSQYLMKIYVIEGGAWSSTNHHKECSLMMVPMTLLFLLLVRKTIVRIVC